MASVGETLRSAREQRGLSIEQVSHDTRISARFLEALEADRYEALPAPVYVRGFIRSYASYLKLDGTALIVRLSESGGPGADSTQAGARTEARRADPFRRDEATGPIVAPVGRAPEPPRPPPPPREGNGFDDFGSQQTVRRRAGVPGRPLPPPIIPPDQHEDVDEDGLLRRHQGAVLAEDAESRSPSRFLALAGIGLLGVAIAAVTAVLLTRGGDDPVATTISDGSPTRAGGSVVVVESLTPAASATASGTAVPGASGSETPAGSPSPTTADETPPEGEPTSTPTPSSPSTGEETPAPTATPVNTPTPTVPAATATPTFPPTPTSIPTFTPTIVLQPHPVGFQECQGFSCGEPPLRVICPPDGTWFVDAGKDYPNPGWPENTSAITTSQAAAVGENGCQ